MEKKKAFFFSIYRFVFFLVLEPNTFVSLILLSSSWNYLFRWNIFSRVEKKSSNSGLQASFFFLLKKTECLMQPWLKKHRDSVFMLNLAKVRRLPATARPWIAAIFYLSCPQVEKTGETFPATVFSEISNLARVNSSWLKIKKIAIFKSGLDKGQSIFSVLYFPWLHAN